MKDRSCENVVDGRTCGGPAFSWSKEHDNTVLCSACYQQWLDNRDVIAFVKVMEKVKDNPKAQKLLMDMVKGR